MPYLLAANPVNYGKPVKLNCAEALAGALLLAGFTDEAEEVMDVFKWGPAFFSINEFYLNKYMECKTSGEMMIAQEQLIKEAEQMREENRNRQVDLPSSSSSDEEEEKDEEDRESEEEKAGIEEKMDKMDINKEESKS